MKNKFNLIWNPFVKIAGWHSFFIGIIIVIISGILGWFGELVFDGVLDAHFYEHSISQAFIILAIDLISIVIIMYLGSLLIARKTRFVDILGTMTLARAPYLILAIFSLFIQYPSTEEILSNPMIVFSSIPLIIFAIISIPITIWFIALMFNGFKVSTGGKGSKVGFVFTIALILAEIFSKILIKHIIN